MIRELQVSDLAEVARLLSMHPEAVAPFLNDDTSGGLLLTRRREIRAVALYRIRGEMIDVDTLWVRPEHRRRGLGRALLQQFVDCLGTERAFGPPASSTADYQTAVRLIVHETELSNQLFLRSCGLRYRRSCGVWMVFVRQAVHPNSPFAPHNRIGHYFEETR